MPPDAATPPAPPRDFSALGELNVVGQPDAAPHGHAAPSEVMYPGGAMVDGGLKAWTDAGLPLTSEVPKVEPAPVRKLKLDRSKIADLEQVKNRGDSALLDIAV